MRPLLLAEEPIPHKEATSVASRALEKSGLGEDDPSLHFLFQGWPQCMGQHSDGMEVTGSSPEALPCHGGGGIWSGSPRGVQSIEEGSVWPHPSHT